MDLWFKNNIKNIIIGLVIILLAFIFGYFMYPKLHKSSTAITENQKDISSVVGQSQTVKEVTSATDVPVTIVNKPPKVIPPPPEPPLPVGTDRFIVSLSATNEDIASNLLSAEFIADKDSFVNILDKEKNPVSPGAYKLSKDMTPVQIDKVLHTNPYMKWVVIQEGLRKEEIANILASALGWSIKTKNTWITKDTTTDPNYIEGVYYPDTYLIPVAEDPSIVAKRLISKFNDNFAPYLQQFTNKNIKWTTALTLASIVQREASGAEDMPLIAGILWNRLNQNMALEVDSTVQYARGDVGKGWWAPITLADEKIDSPYNTYKYKGLPPHPISNPGISAIEAVLNPTNTPCLYYLHGKDYVTHCAVTYQEHQQNIQLYLK